MARKPPFKYVPREESPEFLGLVAELAGVDPAEFPARARAQVARYHDAVLAGDLEALDLSQSTYEALVYVLNGHTMFGSAADEDRATHVLARAVAAPPGQVPCWGQSGDFLVEVDGMRVRVEFAKGLHNHHGITLHAVDLDRPFLSETGYRSHFVTVTSHLGETVEQAVRRAIAQVLESEGKPKAIEADAFVRRNPKPRPKWLADALAGVLPDGQLAMFGDAPPSDKQVPKSNAERQRALRQRRREQQLKPVMLDESERQMLEELRAIKAKADPIDDPRPFMLTQRDRSCLTSALDFYEFATLKNGFGVSGDYQKTNLRDLYVRMSVHRVYKQATDFPPDEKRQAWSHEQMTQGFYDGYKKKIEALEKENALLESERNKAHSAIALWEQRLRAAGLSTDYRQQPGERPFA
jgi:hypothetical protein